MSEEGGDGLLVRKCAQVCASVRKCAQVCASVRQCERQQLRVP
jgi:hypothetical protein